MNAFVHGFSGHCLGARGLAALVALQIVAACGPAGSAAEPFSLPDGSVVVSDSLEGSTPQAADIAEYGEAAHAGEGPPLEGMPLEPLIDSRPRWILAVDALMLWQGNQASFPLLLDPAGGTALDVGTMGTSLSAGPRASLIRALGECDAIEGNYFQVGQFNSGANVPATGGPYTIVNTVQLPFTDIDSATATGSGMIRSAELNWRRNHCGSPITWLAGFRWVELNSKLNVDYEYTDTTIPAPGTGTLSVESGNDLYGGQAGFDVRLWNAGRRLRLNGIGKAGLFANAGAYQRSSGGFVTDGDPPVSLGTVAANADQVAFFGETGLNASYFLTPWLAWRAGYSVFWASGVAVAAQQLPNSDFGAGTATVNTKGSVMLHGVTTGFEACW
jgi:hypothetical protein